MNVCLHSRQTAESDSRLTSDWTTEDLKCPLYIFYYKHECIHLYSICFQICITDKKNLFSIKEVLYDQETIRGRGYQRPDPLFTLPGDELLVVCLYKVGVACPAFFLVPIRNSSSSIYILMLTKYNLNNALISLNIQIIQIKIILGHEMLFQFKLINHITQLTFIKTHPSSVIVPYCHQPIRMQHPGRRQRRTTLWNSRKIISDHR